MPATRPPSTSAGRSISLEKLRDERFPEDPSGTITEHRRIGDNPLHRLFPLDRLEVMWSARDGTKTVQVEELVAADSIRCHSEEGVTTRYLHARWDPSTERFVHLDGARKVYNHEVYAERLQTDMKKFSARHRRTKKYSGSTLLSTLPTGEDSPRSFSRGTNSPSSTSTIWETGAPRLRRLDKIVERVHHRNRFPRPLRQDFSDEKAVRVVTPVSATDGAFR